MRKNHYGLLSAAAVAALSVSSSAFAQSASALYSWNTPGDVQAWVRNFGTNAATLSQTIPGELTIVETGTAGTDIAITDGGNKVREGSNSSGGTDLTGLSFLEFEMGHNGSGPINVQFFVQASTGFNFVALAPDVAVQPGIATYQLPLAGLTAAQAVYVRTMGFSARAHTGLGNVTWTVRELRSVGEGLAVRNLITHDTGSAEGGLQGALVNFDLGAVQGNNGGQNQTGLSHNPAGSGSLTWTDVGGSNGAAISWGNGTAFNGNTFNERATDLSNYATMTVRMSALDDVSPTGTLNVGAFFQTNNFQFQGAGNQVLITDGSYQELTFSLAGLVNMNSVDLTGINLGAHANNLVVNVDNIRFNAVVPEPAGLALALPALAVLRRRRA